MGDILSGSKRDQRHQKIQPMAASQSPEIRKDAVYNRWVIFSPARARRPSDFKSKNDASSNANSQSECPFCAGHEHERAPEIFRSPPESTSDWKIRVIQNLYPALSRDFVPSTVACGGGSVSVAGFGFHDVVIESPAHPVHLADLSGDQIADVLLAYKKRIDQLRGYDSIKYVQVFKNHGATAGASMSHSHSQILALPILPPTASARIQSMKEHLQQTGECALCQATPDELTIQDSKHFKSIVPFAATFPFEIWIIPRHHTCHFHELDHDKAIDLGGLLKLMLVKMSLQLKNPPYNLMIHSAPLQIDSTEEAFNHWFIQIVPQLTVVGGFELGTGCYINPVLPEDAAKVLREVSVRSEST